MRFRAFRISYRTTKYTVEINGKDIFLVIKDPNELDIYDSKDNKIGTFSSNKKPILNSKIKPENYVKLEAFDNEYRKIKSSSNDDKVNQFKKFKLEVFRCGFPNQKIKPKKVMEYHITYDPKNDTICDMYAFNMANKKDKIHFWLDDYDKELIGKDIYINYDNFYDYEFGNTTQHIHNNYTKSNMDIVNNKDSILSFLINNYNTTYNIYKDCDDYRLFDSSRCYINIYDENNKLITTISDLRCGYPHIAHLDENGNPINDDWGN